jgi:hypothetical protein
MKGSRPRCPPQSYHVSPVNIFFAKYCTKFSPEEVYIGTTEKIRHLIKISDSKATFGVADLGFDNEEEAMLLMHYDSSTKFLALNDLDDYCHELTGLYKLIDSPLTIPGEGLMKIYSWNYYKNCRGCYSCLRSANLGPADFICDRCKKRYTRFFRNSDYFTSEYIKNESDLHNYLEDELARRLHSYVTAVFLVLYKGTLFGDTITLPFEIAHQIVYFLCDEPKYRKSLANALQNIVTYCYTGAPIHQMISVCS